MKYLLFIIALLVAHSSLWASDELTNSACFKKYESISIQKQQEFDQGDVLILDRRFFNLTQAALGANKNYTFQDINNSVLEHYPKASEAEVLKWLHHGFISGDFCPFLPFVSTYFNWKKAGEYIRAKIHAEGLLEKKGN